MPRRTFKIAFSLELPSAQNYLQPYQRQNCFMQGSLCLADARACFDIPYQGPCTYKNKSLTILKLQYSKKQQKQRKQKQIHINFVENGFFL